MRDRWGIDPDVALFIGGPKDGLIENIKGARTQRYAVRDDFQVWSWSDPSPVDRYHVRYYTYEPGRVSFYGDVYTVMVDQREHTRSYIEARVEDETRRSNYLGISTAVQFQSSINMTLDDLKKAMAFLFPEEDTRTDEEKLAWVTEKTPGKKEFL